MLINHSYWGPIFGGYFNKINIFHARLIRRWRRPSLGLLVEYLFCDYTPQ